MNLVSRAAEACSKRPLFFLLLGWALTAAALYFVARLPGLFEPDRLYHLSLFREMRTQHSLALRTWAQFPFLGWDQYFSDKEFLFHALGYPGYRFFGENGFLFSVAVASAGILWLPLFYTRRMRFPLFAAGAAMLLFNPSFLYRLNLARPHVLAVALFTGFVWSLYTRRERSAAFFGLAFTLAYHAFYLPLFLAAVVAADALWRRPERSSFRAATFGGLGLLLGLLVNPYFPSNIVRGLQHLAIALNAAHLPAYVSNRLGSELLGFAPIAFLELFGPAILAFAVATALVWRKHPQARPYLAVGALLWAAAWFSPRTLEFVAPLTVMAFGLAWLERPKLAPWLVGLVAAAHLGVMIKDGSFLLNFNEGMIPPDRFTSMLNDIPPQAQPAVVFHDRWDLGPYITYARPDLAAVEVLDPTYLWLREPRLAEFLNSLALGEVEKSAEAIHEVFKASYALAGPRLAKRLEKDPRAARLSGTKNGQISLYRLNF